MKKVYLHIGPHKTGTTFLQKIFEENKQVLRTAGLDYLDFGKTFFGHHEMALALAQERYEKGVLKSAINESFCDEILLSSENFDVLNSNSLAYLANELSEFNVDVLVFFRTPTVRLYSWWQEEIKHGSTKSYSEYVFQHYSRPFSSEALNLNVLLNRYSEAFGIDAISVFDYEVCVGSGGLLEHFMSHVGVSEKLSVEKERVNDGLSILHVETIRALNINARAMGTLKYHNVRDSYLRKWNKRDPLMGELDKIQKAHCIDVFYGDSYVDKLLKRATVEKYKDRFVTRIGNDYIEKKVEMPESSWVSSSEAQKMLAEIYKAVMV